STLFLLASAHAAITEPVHLDSGAISGAPAKDPAVRVFRGIPYAAPPVGDLRWRAPQPTAHWEGVRSGEQFGPTCTSGAAGRGGKGKAPNPAPAKATPAAVPAASEDCLYVNVWTPAKSASERLPVMLWIYGGGFNSGSGSEGRYEGEMLARKGIVVVTF